MDFLRNLFYVQVETNEGPRLVSRFFNDLGSESEEEYEDSSSDSSVEAPADPESSWDDEFFNSLVTNRSFEIEEGLNTEDVEDPFLRQEHEQILRKIDGLLSSLNGFLQVSETTSGQQPNGTLIKKKNGKVFIARKHEGYEVGLIIEDQSFKLVASYQE
jgi:hypothetical protein